MAEQEGNSAVADSATTPASAEPVGTTESSAPATDTTQTTESSEGFSWDSLDAETETAAPETKTEEEPAKTDEKPVDKTTDSDKKDEKSDSDKPIEDQVLEELFGDNADKKKDGESNSEEDLDNQDPETMIAGQRNATSKAWADRRHKKAQIVDEFQFPDKKTGAFRPISEFAATLESQNKERFAELSQHAAHKLVDTNPDATFARAYAVKMLQQNPYWDPAKATIPTLDELIANQGAASATTPATATQNAQVSELTAELDKTLGFDWRDPANDEEFLVDDREKALAKSLRAMEQKLQAEAASKTELEEKLKAIVRRLQAASMV